MKEIFNDPILNVTEYGNTYKYYVLPDINGIPNYYPMSDKIKINISKGFDEILFLPIEHKNFKPNKNLFVFGFRYSLYTNHGISEEGVPTYRFLFEVRRIRYEITGNNSISINRIYDILHIPRIIQVVNNNTKKVGYQISLNMINNMISENNAWYLDRNI